MDTREFSDRFDVLLNSYTKTADQSDIRDLKLDEYEKSVYLTEAQNTLIKSRYSGKNQFWDSFEISEELSRQLDSLVETAVLTSIDKDGDQYKVSGESYMYKLPDKLLYIIYEQVITSSSDDKCIDGKTMLVVPVRHDDLFKQMQNPFKGPSDTRVLRVNSGHGMVELISKYTISKYLMRYLRQPQPIILTDLSVENLDIEGVTAKTECELNEMLHEEILRMAVNNALQSRARGELQPRESKQ